MIDTHAHILDEAFDADREALISDAKEAGLGWVEVGTGIAESRAAEALARLHGNICASVGVHPDNIANLAEGDWVVLSDLAASPAVCAIGEVGFDTFRNGTIAEQEPVLRRFIALAQKVRKPVIFHVRSGNGVDAHAELLRVLASYDAADRPRGVIHTFSGTLDQAKRYIEHGMMISFSGVLTFKNAGELPQVATELPLESVLAETDCPYLTPEPNRGKRNEPKYVEYVIRKIAELRERSFEDIDAAISENARTLFAIDK